VVCSDELIVKAISLGGSINADSLDLALSGAVGSDASIQAIDIADADADNDGFVVGGDFSGRMDAGNFETGIGASATLVAGTLSSGAKFNVAGTFGGAGAAEFVFIGPIDGELSIGGDLDADLLVQGQLEQATIGGSVNSSITVLGNVDFLSTGSLFDATSTTTGDFLDGVGTATGDLLASLGYTDIVPTA